MRYSVVAALPKLGRRLLLLVLLFCCAYSSAQPSIGQRQATSEKHSLTGTVVNSFTGAPIPYALVQAGEHAKLTDQNGNFSFEDLPYTSIGIVAHKPGFFEPRE